MLSGRTRSDKVEMIKTFIRQNKYRDYENTYEQCMDVGISVDLMSIARFSEKLELLDRTERSKRLNKVHKEKAQPENVMTYEQVKQRETEITFALGELKIQENKLLEELNKLSKSLDSKEFN